MVIDPNELSRAFGDSPREDEHYVPALELGEDGRWHEVEVTTWRAPWWQRPLLKARGLPTEIRVPLLELSDNQADSDSWS